MSVRSPEPPSPRWGCQQAHRLWRLVIAVWVVAWLAMAPALLLLWRLIVPGLAALPAGPGEVPAGDVALIILEAGREAWIPLALALLFGLVVLWAWSVLWHAGVVSWQLWMGGQRVRLGELLGLGVAAWWRYARLSAAALTVLVVTVAAVAVPLLWAALRALGAMAEGRLVVVVVAGMVAVKLVAIVVWLATLHGAWLLGLPERRSAVVAWLHGLQATARRPLVSLWCWLVWLVPALAVSAVAPLAGAVFEGMRGGALLVGVGLLASLARAFCWVGLFCSFAPIAGVVGIAETRIAATADNGRPIPRGDTTKDFLRRSPPMDAPPSSASSAIPDADAEAGRTAR